MRLLYRISSPLPLYYNRLMPKIWLGGPSSSIRFTTQSHRVNGSNQQALRVPSIVVAISNMFMEMSSVVFSVVLLCQLRGLGCEARKG